MILPVGGAPKHDLFSLWGDFFDVRKQDRFLYRLLEAKVGKMSPKCLPNERQHAPKTPPKTASKKTASELCKKYLKMIPKMNPENHPEINKNRPKSDPVPKRFLLDARGLILDTQDLIFGVKTFIFGRLGIHFRHVFE